MLRRFTPTLRLQRLAIHTYSLLIAVFLLAPILVVTLASLHANRYMAFPIEAYSLRWYAEVIETAVWRQALQMSLVLALQTTVIASAVGILAALAIHYHDFPGKHLITLFFLSPLLMPQLLIGLALLFFFGQYGLSGSYTPLLLGHVLIAFPFVVRMILAALPNVTRRLEEAAMTLGANEATALFTVTLPLIGPAIRGGAVFAFVTSYNNVLISLFLSTARAVPLPIRILTHLEWIADPSVAAVSTLFLLLTFVLLFVIERSVGIELFPLGERDG